MAIIERGDQSGPTGNGSLPIQTYTGTVSVQPDTCVNHPDAETRISCSTCGAPICTRCMRQSAVGQKCPSCARSPRRARALGRPVHYVRGLSAGLGTGIAGGILLLVSLRQIGFGRIILSALVGFLVGRAVRWGASGQTQDPWPQAAAGCAVVGILSGFWLAAGTIRLSLFLVLGLAAAAWAAVRGLHN